MGQNNSSENLLAYTRAIAIVPLLFEAILFLFLVYGIVVFLNNLYLYVFLLQIPHLFLLTCLFIGITSPQVFSIVFFSLTTYALATILDILAFLIRFIFSVVVLTSFDYWLFFVVSIALIVNDLIAVAVLMVISCASATVIQTTTSDPSSIDSKTTANMRGRLDFIWVWKTNIQINTDIFFLLLLLLIWRIDHWNYYCLCAWNSCGPWSWCQLENPLCHTSSSFDIVANRTSTCPSLFVWNGAQSTNHLDVYFPLCCSCNGPWCLYHCHQIVLIDHTFLIRM